MTADEMWKASGLTGPWEAWAFGDAPDELAKLVREGVKTATASAAPLYEMEGEPLPKAGERSVILDARDQAVCIIQTTAVSIVPFCEVGAEQARKEGEGDRSLEYWRRVHRDFFQKEMEAAGLQFDESMPVVCEEFVRIWPKDE